MYVYYQSVEDGHQQWKVIRAADEEQIRREKAFHMGIYKISEQADSQDREKLKYKGDFWIDIDHAPKEDTPASKHEALKAAIMDVRRVLSYFESIGLDPKYCRIFASGSKGFHVGVPAVVMDATAAVKHLPRIHKYMAKAIQERCMATGIDMQLYCEGKGRLLRVENKLRANGKYKVPVTYEEVKVMTPEMYVQLTSAPRVETVNITNEICQELSLLFSEARNTLQHISKLQFTVVPSTDLVVFNDSETPNCVSLLAGNVSTKHGEGRFNLAKLSLSRYLMNAPITDVERNRLIDEFAENWQSTRHPTQESRRKAVKEALTYGRENGFSCNLMKEALVVNPCNGCKLKQEQRRRQADNALIETTDEGYFRSATNGQGARISNFTLQADAWYQDITDNPNFFYAYDYKVIKDGEEQGELKLTHNAWNSNSEFKKQVSRFMGLSWTGQDMDLQHLKALLTDPTTLSGVTQVKTVPTLGIHYHVDEKRGINEFVWVEEDWSVNAHRLVDSLRFNGTPCSQGKRRSVRMAGLEPYYGGDEHCNEIVRALLACNDMNVVIPVLGWTFACWLRTHVRAKESTDRHLPALQIHGASGEGKTETATLFSMLAGADYASSDEPVTVGNSTPYTIRTEGSISTTVPRILDEMNEHKIGDKTRYKAARELVKASARASSQPRGVVKDGGIHIDYSPATSPLIMLATQLNPEKEIAERTVPVAIKSRQCSDLHKANFYKVREENNIVVLKRVAKLAMEVTLGLTIEEVADMFKEGRRQLPGQLKDNRTARNWETVLVGIDFAKMVFTKGKAPEDIIKTLEYMKSYQIDWLTDKQTEIVQSSNQQEIDIIIQTFGEMIANDMGSIARKYKAGENYIVSGDTLHIWSTVFFTQYQKYCRNELGRVPELSVFKQYQELLNLQPYHLGKGVVQNVPAPSGWNSFSISGLRDRGVNVENFYLDT